MQMDLLKYVYMLFPLCVPVCVQICHEISASYVGKYIKRSLNEYFSIFLKKQDHWKF